MPYRPEGWDTLDIYASTEYIGMTPFALIEAGADAMLEGLKKEETLDQVEVRGRKGTVVFIEDDNG